MLALVEQENVQQKPKSKESSSSFIGYLDLKAETSQSVSSSIDYALPRRGNDLMYALHTFSQSHPSKELCTALLKSQATRYFFSLGDF